MNTTQIPEEILKRALEWTQKPYDPETCEQVKQMIECQPAEIIDSFYRDLEFGTGGLRGIMGPGTNRMNKYTVGMATQGLANYLITMFNHQKISVAIAFDSRNNSPFFARIAAEVLSANGIKVLLFESLRPTPVLSFTIRHYGCQSGIVITASHNPKEYNGYKVYWEDGAQLVAPHDEAVINEARKITGPHMVNFSANESLIQIIGQETDQVYIEKVKSLSINPQDIARQKNLKIVYTPLHGTGVHMVPLCLKAFGFENIITVKEQCIPDGNFPTVKSPNPEERTALEMALKLASETNADILMATDPDADRVGVAVKTPNGWELLNGNQTAVLLTWYLLNQWKEKQWLKGNEFIVKTIVTTELMAQIAQKFGVEYYDVLTGFKFIAEIIRENEGQKTFIGGGEESYGFLVGDFVRDKDAVSACCMIAETAAWAACRNKTLADLLNDIYLEYGFYFEDLLSITRKGKEGAEEINNMMQQFRNFPFQEIAGVPVIRIKDYLLQHDRNLAQGWEQKINLPKSDVIQFFTEDGSVITVRPSGTEPKIKFYFGVKASLTHPSEIHQTKEICKEKIQKIKESLSIG